MNIKIEYQPTAKELTKASSLFAEKKPFLLYTVGFINIFAGIFLVIFSLTLVVSIVNSKVSFPIQWLAALAVCFLWLFGRRPFNEWLLYQRMKRSIVLSKPITIEISLNGIVWAGKGLRQGHMTWDQVKYVLEAKNGFVFPNSFTTFLWLPFRAFNSPGDIQDLRNIIIEKKIVHRVFSRWEC